MARPFTYLPYGAKTHLNLMAENGLLSESSAASALGMPLEQFRRVVRDHPPSKITWETALAIERDQLLKALYNKAVDGDVSAARTLLAVRHGLSEKSPVGAAVQAQIHFHLPAALNPAEYIKALAQTPQAPAQIEHVDAGEAA